MPQPSNFATEQKKAADKAAYREAGKPHPDAQEEAKSTENKGVE
ncbi:MAG: hypothetical protein AAFQ04_08655 [Pseudomonadota bacterium]